MEVFLAAIALLAGIVIVVVAAERFVEGLLGSAKALGLSTFALGVVFGGFDPDNLGAGVASLLNDLPSVAMGTVLGSATFLLTVGVGIVAVLVPLQVRVAKPYLALTLAAPFPLLLLALDNELSRWEGLLLNAIFIPILAYVLIDARREKTAFIMSEEAREIAKHGERPRWFFPSLMLLSLLAIAGGAELMGWGAKGIVDELEVSQTLFGMVFIAAAVSFEEVARGAIPAFRGHPEVSIGNILGTLLFFVLFNAGFMALVRPIRVEDTVIALHWPFMMGVVAVAVLLILRQRIGRREGALLLLLYALYLSLAVLFR